ncbi:MAG: hypothetical protein IK020_12245 [Clostridiales bacterium]|nr:hypothetical protein [Clostridiales bacterium]
MEKCKTMISVLLIAVLLLVPFQYIKASNDEFSLLEYCESHLVSSQEDFEKVLEDYCNQQYSYDESDVVLFSINIDYEGDFVCTTTIREKERSPQSETAEVEKNYYDDDGNRIFTIRVEGTFQFEYSWCACTSANGSFSKPLMSMWSSSPTISTGNNSATVAYARISGTATYLFQTKSYSLTLTCDNHGNLGTY